MSKTTIAIIIVLVFGIELNAQTKDSLASKNQKKIEEIKSRITNAENTINGNTALAAENEKLKLRVKQQEDTIAALNRRLREAKEISTASIQTGNSKCIRLVYNNEQTNLNYSLSKELDSLVNLCLKNPKLKLKLSGHANKYGPEDYNMSVSKMRVMLLKSYLISEKKLNPENILTEWHGSSMPLESGKQSLNRRVEVYIY